MSIRPRGRHPVKDFVSSLFSAVPIAVAYYAWSKGPVATSQIPLRSAILMAVVSALTIASFILGWKDGVEYEGFMDTVALAMINFLLAAITLGNLYKPVLQLIIESFAVHRFTLR